jgi:hypothetical protein
VTLRRWLAAAAIVLVVAAFVTVGVVAALVAGHQLDRAHPAPSPSPTATP